MGRQDSGCIISLVPLEATKGAVLRLEEQTAMEGVVLRDEGRQWKHKERQYFAHHQGDAH